MKIVKDSLEHKVLGALAEATFDSMTAYEIHDALVERGDDATLDDVRRAIAYLAGDHQIDAQRRPSGQRAVVVLRQMCAL